MMSGRHRDGRDRDHRQDRDRSRSASRDSRGPGRGGRGGFRGRGRGRGGGRQVSEKEIARKQTKEEISRMEYEGESELLDYRAYIARHHDTLNIKAGIERLDIRDSAERDEREEVRDRSKKLDDLPLARMNGGEVSGRKIKLKTNSYQITFNPAQRFYVYQLLEVKVVAKGRAPELKKGEKRAVIEALSRNLSSRISFDGDSCLIWNQEFRRQSFGRDGEIWEDRRDEFGFELHGVKRENGKIDTVQGKLIYRMDVGLENINQFIQGQSFDVPYDCIQAVDIIVRTLPALSAKYLSKGRSAFCEIFNQDADQRNMPGGMTVWHGICQSAKISSWKSIGTALTLNADVSYGLFMRQQLMEDLVDEYEGHLQALEEKIKHLTIEVKDGPKPFYKFGQFTRRRAADTEIFIDGICNMVDYYHREGSKINPNHICVETTTKTKDKSGRCKYQTFPLEHVRLVGGQRPKGLMSERTKADFIRTTAEAAPVRQAKIQQMMESNDIYDREQLEQYGLRISKEAMDAEGTVLVTPKVYANQGQEVDMKKNDDGMWHIDTFERPAKPINRNWIRVVIGMNSERPRFDQYWEEFGQRLCQVGTSLGVPMSKPIFSEWLEDGVQFGAYCEHMKNKSPEDWAKLDFILVCLDNNADTYSLVKVAAELNHGVMTQCVLPKTVMKNDSISLRNLFYKINKKLGGHNWRIPVPLPECPVPIMLIGISLSHAEKDSSDPSIAGFVGTTLQGGVGYKNYVDCQHPGLAIVAKEVIRRAMESLLSKYREINNGALPEKLIIYRNGGSEGCYQAILKNEFMGIREALAEMKEGYQPGITFISAMRASRQKFFAVDDKDKTGMGENVPIGTCVSGFGNGTPDSYAFHLLSHSAVGCANPTFYQILHDDNNIELENMVNMTYALTMATQRCNKSTSHTTPVFLANLLTERARSHWKGTSLGIALRKHGYEKFHKDHKLRVKTIERFQSEVFFI